MRLPLRADAALIVAHGEGAPLPSAA